MLFNAFDFGKFVIVYSMILTKMVYDFSDNPCMMSGLFNQGHLLISEFLVRSFS